MQYANKLELMLTLVGYAVGIGNVWRFPYLTYTYGGGAFLVPYFLSLFMLGLPLFILELGLGQMMRQGTLGVWKKLNMPRLQGAGAAATVCTFMVSLYYNVVLAWTIYYLGRTIGSVTSGTLPWDDQVAGFSCPESVLFPHSSVANGSVINSATGLFNMSHAADFWCPETGIPSASSVAPSGFVSMAVKPSRCPAAAAMHFWQNEVLQQTSGMDVVGGFQPYMLLSYTLAWLLIYLCICKGVASSGKVVYVTATLPYVALVVFFFRAITLPGALQGVEFFVKPDFSLLLDGTVWLRAVTQIFFSLGVGFGSLVAFASYGNKHSDFVRDAVTVSFINCGTSIFAGFVVFPVLGFLAKEMSQVNPCIQGDNLAGLSSVGLSGTGLAFIAFPIAIAQMPGGIVWSFLFFIMLLCLGIDSEFAMCESVITVLHDAGVNSALERKLGRRVPKPVFTGAICFISYILGLIFVTRSGLYWFNLFDNYTCVVAPFLVTLIECVGLMVWDWTVWPGFKNRVQAWTGRELGCTFVVFWRYLCPALLTFLFIFAFTNWDLQGARSSKPFPEGSGYLPKWSVAVGWVLGLLPVVAFAAFAIFGGSGTKEGAAEIWMENLVGGSCSEDAAHAPAVKVDAADRAVESGLEIAPEAGANGVAGSPEWATRAPTTPSPKQAASAGEVADVEDIHVAPPKEAGPVERLVAKAWCRPFGCRGGCLPLA